MVGRKSRGDPILRATAVLKTMLEKNFATLPGFASVLIDGFTLRSDVLQLEFMLSKDFQNP